MLYVWNVLFVCMMLRVFVFFVLFFFDAVIVRCVVRYHCVGPLVSLHCIWVSAVCAHACVMYILFVWRFRCIWRSGMLSCVCAFVQPCGL